MCHITDRQNIHQYADLSTFQGVFFTVAQLDQPHCASVHVHHATVMINLKNKKKQTRGNCLLATVMAFHANGTTHEGFALFW